ncbi:type II toxin-antitoxin system VapC family toxin [bacterium]|nr:type II toxin-antitoxin system VapC family toxin [bacterium]MBU1599195.1 type II toxin-antitoxin system VapC family toxin [bacterium]MBU2462215.1 type II toxin-antitoxin system VapC family toxin [bacterium]
MVYFLDTNIIMYAVGKEHPYKKPCQEIIAMVNKGKISVVTNTEVIQEILYRYLSLKMPQDAFENAEDTINLTQHILPINKDEIEIAIELLKKHYPLIYTRDAIHVATMLNHGIDKIISTDKHFDILTEIKRIDPLNLQNL